jgi:hypothetical protein
MRGGVTTDLVWGKYACQYFIDVVFAKSAEYYNGEMEAASA